MTDPDAPLEPRLLRAFLVVAEELHFGRAARRLHISQPPLSVQIRRLEEHVGARLLDRDRRHVALTEAGALLAVRARHLLSELDRARDEARRVGNGELGTLSVGYTPTASHEVLPRLVKRYRERSPHNRLELIELRSAEQPPALHAGRIEIGLACGPVGDRALVERTLAAERFRAAVPRSHPLAGREGVRLLELAEEPWVAVRADIEPAWADAFRRAAALAGLVPDVAQETDSKIALLGLVAAGVGVAAVSESMGRLRRSDVVLLPILDLDVQVPLVALTRRSPSPRASEFLGD